MVVLFNTWKIFILEIGLYYLDILIALRIHLNFNYFDKLHTMFMFNICILFYQGFVEDVLTMVFFIC